MMTRRYLLLYELGFELVRRIGRKRVWTVVERGVERRSVYIVERRERRRERSGELGSREMILVASPASSDLVGLDRAHRSLRFIISTRFPVRKSARDPLKPFVRAFSPCPSFEAHDDLLPSFF